MIIPPNTTSAEHMEMFFNRIFVLFVFLSSVMLSKAQIVTVSEEYFPDPEFRRLLIDKHYDDHPEKIPTITTLDLEYQWDPFYPPYDIKSLKGLEYFVSLRNLKLYNFRFEENFDFSCFEYLSFLDYYSDIDTLDLSGLNVGTLVVQACCNHFVFPKSVNNSMDVMICGNNDFVDVVFPYYSKLKTLSIGAGNMKSLDLSNCPNLENLKIRSAYLENINIQKNFKLRNLQFPGNFYSIRTLNISGNPNLEFLELINCPIESLNIKYNNKLQRIDICNSNLKDWDIMNMPHLNTLRLMYNKQLASLNIQNVPELKELDCRANSLEKVNLTNIPKLEIFYCCYNKLTSLDLSFPNLYRLHLHRNQIGEEAMTKLINDLPDKSGVSSSEGNSVILDMHDSEEEGNFMITKELFDIAKSKNWYAGYAILGNNWQTFNYYLKNDLTYFVDSYRSWDFTDVGLGTVLKEPSVDNIYNINGQRIISPSQKGLYIRNGKKYVK